MKKQMCMFLVFVFLLVGCGGQNDKADNDMKPDLEANLLYENTISPTEKLHRQGVSRNRRTSGHFPFQFRIQQGYAV